MKFGSGAVTALLLLLGGGSSADAFHVKGPISTTVVQRQIQTAANELITRPQMAAGGAERAYGDDYYDGALLLILLLLLLFR
jgi:hypothetical protein